MQWPLALDPYKESQTQDQVDLAILSAQNRPDLTMFAAIAPPIRPGFQRKYRRRRADTNTGAPEGVTDLQPLPHGA